MSNRKSLTSVLLAAVMAMGPAVPAFAEECPEKQFTVYSPVFPNAYILVEQTKNGTENINAIQAADATTSITATVFVEEKWDIIDGEWVIIDSKLLSEEEVCAIGLENFENLYTVSAPTAANPDVTIRGKLTLRLGGTHEESGSSATVHLSGRASWSGFDVSGKDEGPAVGADYMCFTWGGGFLIDGTPYTNAISSQGKKIEMHPATATANAGEAWSFNEHIQGTYKNDYAKQVDINMNLKKNVMTGGGNVTEAILTYIHTYDAVQTSIGITGGTGGASGSISFTGTSKYWTLVSKYSGFYY